MISREFRAPRTLVWQAWTDPAHIVKWWGPHRFTTPARRDRRPSGRRGALRDAGPRRPRLSEHRHGERSGRARAARGHDNAAAGRSGDRGSPADGDVRGARRGNAGHAAREGASGHRGRRSRAGGHARRVGPDARPVLPATRQPRHPTRDGRHATVPRAESRLVWEALDLGRPDLEAWWGPHGFTTTTSAFDSTPGGQWACTMHGPDGTDYPNLITFREIVHGRRLAYSQSGGRARRTTDAVRDHRRLRARRGWALASPSARCSPRPLSVGKSSKSMVPTRVHTRRWTVWPTTSG